MSYKCFLSGKCCTVFDLQVSRQELEEMKAAGPTFRELNVTEDFDGKTLIIKAPCPWYNNGCTIYSKRPAVCRAYLCYREAPTSSFRNNQDQHDFIESHPDAKKQAQQMRKDAMQYAKEHGWDHLP